MGELLSHGSCPAVLRLRTTVGGEEDPATLDARPGASRLWVEEVEYSVASREAWIVPGLWDNPQAASGESAPMHIGYITPGAKRSGKLSAGKLHAGFDVAGAGNGPRVELGTRSASESADDGNSPPTGTAPASDPT